MENIPNVMIIFGGSGDLAHRKLYPALFNLYRKGLIADNFAVIATARRPWSHDFLRGQVKNAVNETCEQVDAADLDRFATHFYYQSHDVTHVDHYIALKQLAQKLDEKYDCHGNRIFYMAMAPSFFGTIATHINDQKLLGTGFNRLIVEKPFGRDYETAEKLNQEIGASFDEKSVYRIDHYLGKEMIQNILPLRFANPLLKNIWNAEYIKNIQVTLAEKIGVGTRGGYYDNSGALRDMVQNHIFQIITLLAMPAPKNLTSDAIHEAKQRLLQGLQIPSYDEVSKSVVRGQYLASEHEPAYINVDQVAPDSCTETYVAGKVKFTTGPLAGVPIYFRTGKKMREKKSRIDIVLKADSDLYEKANENIMTIEIDPVSKIVLRLNGKEIVGTGLRVEDLSYAFNEEEMHQVPDGYERLLNDVFMADRTNFTHWMELAQYWRYIDAIEAAWRKQNSMAIKPDQYLPNAFGPNAADNIFENADSYWIYR